MPEPSERRAAPHALRDLAPERPHPAPRDGAARAPAGTHAADEPRSARLAELLARIRAIETGGARRALGEGTLATFAGLGGALERGVLHEFCGPGDGPDWSPPLALLVALAQAGLAAAPDGHAAFVGRRVWPHPAAFAARTALAERPGEAGAGGGALLWLEGLAGLAGLEGHAGLDGRAGLEEQAGFARASTQVRSETAWLARLLLVDTSAGERGRATAGALLWAADRALRCSACRVVVVDGSGLTLAAVRRLQLAAEAGGSLALLARPAHEAREPSSAASRWSLERVQSPHHGPCWSVRALRRRSAVETAASAAPRTHAARTHAARAQA
jgi:hypothetical protein